MVSPSKRLGGLSSSGLGWTDSGKKEAIGGLQESFIIECGGIIRGRMLGSGKKMNTEIAVKDHRQLMVTKDYVDF